MKTRQWQGHWIRGDRALHSSPYLRKQFTLSRSPNTAILYLAVAGWHELYVNGKKADDRELSPVVTQFERHTGYLRYDLDGLLREGENTLTVWLGNGWYNDPTEDIWNFVHATWRDNPKLLCDLEVDGETLLVSDRTWKTHASPIIFNALRNGEFYDARLELPGVFEPSFDDTGWENASSCYPPGGILIEEELEPCRVMDEYDGHPQETAPGCVTWDFGINLTGRCTIEVEGPAGATVTLRYAETIGDNGEITQEKIKALVKSGEFQTERYFLKGNGRESWHSRFTYHGFRYCSVATSPDVTVHAVKAQFIHNDFAAIGSFSSSHDVLNRLQGITRHTYLCNYTGIPTDCPHREKNGWTGDAQLAFETGLWNFDIRRAAAHFLRLLVDNQRPSGQLPAIAPCAGDGYNWGSGPAWDIYLFEAPWRIYLFTGDDTLIREFLPAMERYVGYCASMSSGNLVDFGLGDWCCYDRTRMTPVELTSSAYYYYAVKILAQFKPEYAPLSESIRLAINNKFYNGDGTYANRSRTALACALYFNLADEAENKQIVTRLVELVRAKSHTAGFGILGAKYIPRVLAEAGYADDAFKLITQPDFPGWGYWLTQGATTLWEDWRGSNSRNHIMFGDISAWMYQYAAGIVLDEKHPGFSAITVRPQLISCLDFVNASYQSIRGRIAVFWTRLENSCQFDISIPENIPGQLLLPDGTIVPIVNGKLRHVTAQ